MTIALDTNVLASAEGTNGAAMRDKALKLIQRLPVGAVVLPVQTLGELFNVLVRKAKRRPANARAAVLSWRDSYPTVGLRHRNGERDGSGVRSRSQYLGLGWAICVSGSRLSLAFVGGSPRRVYLARRHRSGPVCSAASPSFGGLAHDSRGVTRTTLYTATAPRIKFTIASSDAPG
jgi:predicted nucleic acid-binding protein